MRLRLLGNEVIRKGLIMTLGQSIGERLANGESIEEIISDADNMAASEFALLETTMRSSARKRLLSLTPTERAVEVLLELRFKIVFLGLIQVVSKSKTGASPKPNKTVVPQLGEIMLSFLPPGERDDSIGDLEAHFKRQCKKFKGNRLGRQISVLSYYFGVIGIYARRRPGVLMDLIRSYIKLRLSGG